MVASFLKKLPSKLNRLTFFVSLFFILNNVLLICKNKFRKDVFL